MIVFFLKGTNINNIMKAFALAAICVVMMSGVAVEAKSSSFRDRKFASIKIISIIYDVKIMTTMPLLIMVSIFVGYKPTKIVRSLH